MTEKDISVLIKYRIEKAQTALDDALSRDFHKAFELRQVADYRARDDFTVEEAREILQSAQRFLAAISDYLQQS